VCCGVIGYVFVFSLSGFSFENHTLVTFSCSCRFVVKCRGNGNKVQLTQQGTLSSASILVVVLLMLGDRYIGVTEHMLPIFIEL